MGIVFFPLSIHYLKPNSSLIRPVSRLRQTGQFDSGHMDMETNP